MSDLFPYSLTYLHPRGPPRFESSFEPFFCNPKLFTSLQLLCLHKTSNHHHGRAVQKSRVVIFFSLPTPVEAFLSLFMLVQWNVK